MSRGPKLLFSNVGRFCKMNKLIKIKRKFFEGKVGVTSKIVSNRSFSWLKPLSLVAVGSILIFEVVKCEEEMEEKENSTVNLEEDISEVEEEGKKEEEEEGIISVNINPNKVVTYKYAGLGERMLAFLVDSLLINGCVSIFGYLFAIQFPQLQVFTTKASSILSTFLFACRDLIFSNSAGKQLLGLVTLDANTGNVASPIQLLIKRLFYLPSVANLFWWTFLPEYPSLIIVVLISSTLSFCDVALQVFTAGNRSLGDIIAGVVVAKQVTTSKFSSRPAGLGQRAVAGSIDLLVSAAVSSLVLYPIYNFFPQSQATLEKISTLVFSAAFSLRDFFTESNRSVGKAIVGISNVDNTTGKYASTLQIFMKRMVYLPSLLLTVARYDEQTTYFLAPLFIVTVTLYTCDFVFQLLSSGNTCLGGSFSPSFFLFHNNSLNKKRASFKYDSHTGRK